MLTSTVFFVYGTLKRGHINHGLLAPHARRIEVAEVDGLLYDVGDFPALVSGDSLVFGEAVWVDSDRLPTLLPLLDRLEHCVPDHPEDSYYLRRNLEIRLGSGESIYGYAYFYNEAHRSLPSVQVLVRLDTGVWQGPQDRNPAGDTLKTYREHVRSFVDHNPESESR